MSELRDRGTIEESAETKALKERLMGNTSSLMSKSTAATSNINMMTQSVEQQELTERVTSIRDEFQMLLDLEMEDVDQNEDDTAGN